MFTKKLRRRFGTAPSSTRYDGVVGSRVELSGTTFSNWVDKTVNVLGGLGVGVGKPVYLDLVNTDPGHWVTAVWMAMIWRRGYPVTERDDGDTALAVVGPASQIRGPVTMMYSLHPLGLGLADLPAGCMDYADVLAEPDIHWEEPVPPDDLTWLPDITRAGLERFPGPDQRLLFAGPPLDWKSVWILLVSLTLRGNSTVVVTGAPPEHVSRAAAEEEALLTRVGKAP